MHLKSLTTTLAVVRNKDACIVFGIDGGGNIFQSDVVSITYLLLPLGLVEARLDSVGKGHELEFTKDVTIVVWSELVNNVPHGWDGSMDSGSIGVLGGREDTTTNAQVVSNVLSRIVVVAVKTTGMLCNIAEGGKQYGVDKNLQDSI